MKEVNSRDKGESAGDKGWAHVNSVLGVSHNEAKYRAFSEAIREYELADKLTEINQKKSLIRTEYFSGFYTYSCRYFNFECKSCTYYRFNY